MPVPSLEETERRSAPVRDFLGMQVVDPRGIIVGSVKDIVVSKGRKNVSLIISTRNKVDAEVLWEDIQAIEDVVLLSKVLDIPVSPAPQSPSCPTCKAPVPEDARFCSTCGARLRP